MLSIKSKVVRMLIGFGCTMLVTAWPCGAHDHDEKAEAGKPEDTPVGTSYGELCKRLQAVEKELEESKHFWRIGPHENEPLGGLTGLSVTGQMTAIYQTTSLKLDHVHLVDATGARRDLERKDRAATFSADLNVEKTFDPGCYILFDIEYGNGLGVDGNLPGGAQVDNDVIENPDHHNEPFIARAFYEHNLSLAEGYSLTFDLGKFCVADFFDKGNEVTDQTTQFINQAICNNGAFDYVQDLEGHGYTYGVRAAADSPWLTLSGGLLSADSYLDNIADKYSVIGELDIKADYTDKIKGIYRVYAWKNYGEYARFDKHGNLVSKDPDKINTSENADKLDKSGWGISLDQSLPLGINIFGRYGRQQDNRDVRHYQDQDENIMFGMDVSGDNWGREDDIIGVAYEIGRLTGNHRKAQEVGYDGFFTHSGIGKGNYGDERVLEAYYRFAFTKHVALSLDYQHFENFDYSRKIGDANFWGGRFHVSF